MGEYAAALALVAVAWLCFGAEPLIPCFGLLTVAGLLLGGYGVWKAFSLDSLFGWCTMGAGLAGGAAAYAASLKWLLPRTNLMLRHSLSPPEAALAEARFRPEAGARGRAKSALRPAGTAVFAGGECEVWSAGGVVAPGMEIEVTERSGGRVFVRPLSAGDA